MRRVESKPGREAIKIREPGGPVHDALFEAVALEFAGVRCVLNRSRGAHFGAPLARVLVRLGSTFFGPKRR